LHGVPLRELLKKHEGQLLTTQTFSRDLILICLQWNTGNPVKAGERGNPRRIDF
jgi:hypothetical protein